MWGNWSSNTRELICIKKCDYVLDWASFIPLNKMQQETQSNYI